MRRLMIHWDVGTAIARARWPTAPVRARKLLAFAAVGLVSLWLGGSGRGGQAHPFDDVHFASDTLWPADNWLLDEPDDLAAASETILGSSQALQPPADTPLLRPAQAPVQGEPAAPPLDADAPPDPTDQGATGRKENPAIEPQKGDKAASAKQKDDEKPTKENDVKKKDEKPVIPDLAKGILIATNDGDLTFRPGLRIQPRYSYDTGDNDHDFYLRRFRIKGAGSAYGVANYGVEFKIDNEERFAAVPAARVENAWVDFPLPDEQTFLRAGLYDLPFSRDALTSDSKLMFMDRSLIKEALTSVGMADNTSGLLLHGRPGEGQFEYAFGIFDNDQFERFGLGGPRESDKLMPAGRLAWNLLDPATPPGGYADYFASYLGQGNRLAVGVSGAYLNEAVEALQVFDVTAWGVDVFANSGHYTFQAEYDQFIEHFAGGPNLVVDGWYAQFGYLVNPCDPCLEFAVRHEELANFFAEDLRWTRVGFNYYIREHNLKVQVDYCFRSGTTLTTPLPGGLGLFDEDVFEIELQLDF